MFKTVDPKQSFPDLEKGILEFWKKNKIFEKSLDQSKKTPRLRALNEVPSKSFGTSRDKSGQAKRFNFYDGPPFATGLPHYGHILAMAIKDTIVRYKTMQGYYVPRRFGWDCHGLPVEYEVEKELKISGKPEIEKYGIGKFNQVCRNIVLRYTSEWKKTIERMGRWGDLDNAYVTMDNDYIETIWWAFKNIWDKKMVYKGFKSMPYCPRCGTPLSNFETNQGYRENTPDPSVFVKFKLKADNCKPASPDASQGGLKTYFLAWTTTPWTLPGNAALAIGKNIKYVKIKIKKDYLILAEDRLSVIDEKYTIIDRLSHKELVNLEYEPLYSFIPFKEKAHYVVLADFVSTEDGTGIVHIAPAFGEDDLNLGLKLDLPIIQTVDKNGKMLPEIKPWAGQFVKKADLGITRDLGKKGLLYKQGIIHHTYPFCWRCDTPLIYLAISTWFIKVSAIRDKLVKNNQKIHWVPDHIKKGRFGKWLAEARDWAVTRNRYWGSPVPIWQCKCDNIKVIGSIAELEKLGGKKIKDLHRPFIDKVTFKCEKCGGKMVRVEEVFDCWFESGSMPYGQYHYPFTEKADFKNKFPADFIAEGLDQTRGWFYTLHVIATILFDKPAFLNSIVNGIILASDGKKLSKRLRNYPEPGEIFDHQGADGLRWFLLSSPAAVAEDVRFSSENVADTIRRNILILWNVYSFFISYANLDKWQPTSKQLPANSYQLLDQWILTRLHETISTTTKFFDAYDLPHAIRPIEEFINDLSTWYLRRSRKRRDSAFYKTMCKILITISKLIAPFAPYVSESIYQNIRLSEDPKSVHLCDWPVASRQSSVVSRQLLAEMQQARIIVEKAHAIRAEKGIKVRQPLQKLKVKSKKLKNKELLQIIADEINVKKVIIDPKQKEEVVLDTKITPELKEEGIAKELIRQIQNLRKKNAYTPDNKIKLTIGTESDIVHKAIIHKKHLIEKSVIAESIGESTAKQSSEDIHLVNIDGEKVYLKIERV